MSYNFRTGQFVNHGSAASLDNLAQASGGFTTWSWVYRAANGNNQHIISKDVTLNGWLLAQVNSPANGCLRGIVWRTGASDADAISSGSVIALDTPTFAAMTFDTAASPTIKLFTGTVSVAVAEVSYNTQASGAGTPDSDSAADLYVGNLNRSTTLFWQGSVQMGGIISGSTLSAAQLETIRGLTVNAIVSDTDLSDVQAAFAHVLLFNYQAANVTDRSGTGNNGTVTGAQSGPDFPFSTSSGGGGSVFGALGGVLT